MPPKSKNNKDEEADSTLVLPDAAEIGGSSVPAKKPKKPRAPSSKPKKEPANKGKRQKKDKAPEESKVVEIPEGDGSLAQHSTKSTVTAEAFGEESKVASVGPSASAKGKKKSARNRTQLAPTLAAGDFIDGDSDDEEFKEAIAKAAAVELEESG